jgi:hypothetical protein
MDQIDIVHLAPVCHWQEAAEEVEGRLQEIGNITGVENVIINSKNKGVD